MENGHLRRVLVVQRRLTHYRVPFFEALKKQMAERNFELILAYGNGTVDENAKHDNGEIMWGQFLNTYYAFSGKFCWQPFKKLARDVDMVIITHENKLIYNLIVQYGYSNHRIGLWGHGANLQGDPNSIREWFKRILARRADWWFAYTSISVPLIKKSGFPSNRITVLNNSIDTSSLIEMNECVSEGMIESLRSSIGLNGHKIGIFVGSLYKEKRIEFMLDAVKEIKQKVLDFEFLIVGNGPQQALIEEFCVTHPWAHYLGVQIGQDKVNAMKLSRVMINPGLVGLGILDSFACRVPMMTTDCGLHSPEIAYLENDINGVMTSNTLDSYVDAVSTLLQEDLQLKRLIEGCERSSVKYTIENMAYNFADGIDRCLASPPYRGQG
jgi:glycosyltransferase involved in cell wall biosynthesis